MPEKATKNAVIYANGFPDNYSDAHLPIAAARSFYANGFAALRFNPRGRYPSKGSFIKYSGIISQARDIESAVRFLKKRGFRNIGLVGHSMGGAASIVADKRDINAIVLWEPSSVTLFKKYFMKKSILEAIKKQDYYADTKNGYLIGSTFTNDISKFEPIWKSRLSDKKMPPVLFIAGGKSTLLKYVKEYHSIVKGTKSIRIIKGATHTFDDHEHEKILLKQTADWLKKYNVS